MKFYKQIRLFGHQKEGLEQSENLNRVAYYWDMGLGKTFVGSEKMAQLGARAQAPRCCCCNVRKVALPPRGKSLMPAEKGAGTMIINTAQKEYRTIETVNGNG